MRFVLLVALLSITACAATVPREPFPVSTHGNDIRAAFLEPERHIGEMVGFSALVQEIKDGPKGKPLIRVLLPKPNDSETSIWVGLLMKPEPGQIEVGEIISVLGYLDRIDRDDPYLESVGDSLFVLGLCLVDRSDKRGLYLAYLPEGAKQCRAWQGGTSPADLGGEKGISPISPKKRTTQP